MTKIDGWRGLLYLLLLLELGLILVGLPFDISAQVPALKNPTGVTFLSPDHATVTGYEIDILSSTGAVVQTLVLGRGTQDAQGVVTLTLAVQPIAFGTYTLRIRAVAGASKSADSPPSDPWERVPGSPSKPTTK
jgi:hypothetical protein